jgi:acetyl-CoA carboxylase carboxyl transferase subunit beta
MDIKFMNGSMGSVVGEKATRLIELATNLRIPLILICASRGARIQEGIFSLIQMAKITSALHAYKETKNSVYIAVLTSPTSGSVAASFAMLGDIVISEPQALIGFARRKGVQQKPFETSELLFEQGLLDIIVESSLFKEVLSEIIELYNESPCFYKKDVSRMSTNPQTWKKKNNLLEP